MNDTISIHIDTSALRANLETLRSLTDRTLLAPCVKGNAYGHGLVKTARALAEAGADWLSVNSIQEMIELRRADVHIPILIMGYIPVEEIETLTKYKDVYPFIYSTEAAENLSRAAQDAGVITPLMLKVDTGMSRQGFRAEEVETAAKTISDLPNLKIVGLATHTATADEKNTAFLKKQKQAFETAQVLVASKGNRLEYVSFANSAALIQDPSYHYDLVRPGIGIYGLYPSPHIKKICEQKNISLTPTLTLKTIVAQTKKISKGDCVSYGCTYKAGKPTRIAVLPIGYADGLDRKLSNAGEVLIAGQRAPIVGRVCMNITMVDITHIDDVQPEDEVVLIGRQDEQEITADEIAEKVDTINYEITARLRESIPRIYT